MYFFGYTLYLLSTVCFCILLSISTTALPWSNLFNVQPDKKEVSIESKNNHHPLQIWLITQSPSWFALERPELQNFLGCPLKFISLQGAPSQEHKTQIPKITSCFWKLWLTFKEFSVSRWPCLKYKQMNGSWCKTEIFTHSGPHLGDPEIKESILMS